MSVTTNFHVAAPLTAYAMVLAEAGGMALTIRDNDFNDVVFFLASPDEGAKLAQDIASACNNLMERSAT